MFTRPQCESRVRDGARDRISVVPGQPEACRDLRITIRSQGAAHQPGGVMIV
jgi:hypothetical protein